MQFGSSTMFLRERSVTTALNVIARAGFAAAEVWVEHVVASGETPAAIGQRARQLRLHLSVHAASYDLNISSTNAGIRNESIRQMEESLHIAAQMGASVVAMHPGHLSHNRDSEERVWQPLLDTLATLDDLALSLGVHLGVEGMERRKGEYLVEPAALARVFARPWQATGMTIDLAHGSTIMDPLAYIDAVSRFPIMHAHCSDNTTEKTHLPLGRGALDVPALLRALQHCYDGVVVLEGYVPGQGESIIPANAAYLRAHALL